MIACPWCGQANNLGRPCKYCGAPIPQGATLKNVSTANDHKGPYLNIRCGPGFGYNVVGILYPEDRVEVQKQVDGWAKIGDGKWSSMFYLKMWGMVT